MNIVKKIEEGADRKTIDCSTYQMRNFFTQFGDGFFQSIDFMNYVQHYEIVKRIKKDNIVVDMCCGRSLLCPFIKYYKKDIGKYIGVDISQSNIDEAKRLEIKKNTYAFPHEWLLCNVTEMSKQILINSVDMIVYTSAIEHMQPVWGQLSLIEAYKILKPGGTLILSAPNTSGDGYNVQYKAAHIYEWNYTELVSFLTATGFTIEEEHGIFMSNKDIAAFITLRYGTDGSRLYERIKEYVPNEFLSSIFSVPFAKESKEVLFVCKKPDRSNSMFDLVAAV